MRPIQRILLSFASIARRLRTGRCPRAAETARQRARHRARVESRAAARTRGRRRIRARSRDATTLRLRAGLRAQLGRPLERAARSRGHRCARGRLQQRRQRSHRLPGDHRSRRRRTQPGVARLARRAARRATSGGSGCCSTTSAGSATAAGARTSRPSTPSRSNGSRPRAHRALRLARPRAPGQRRRCARSARARARPRHPPVQCRAGARATSNGAGTPTLHEDRDVPAGVDADLRRALDRQPRARRQRLGLARRGRAPARPRATIRCVSPTPTGCSNRRWLARGDAGAPAGNTSAATAGTRCRRRWRRCMRSTAGPTSSSPPRRAASTTATSPRRASSGAARHAGKFKLGRSRGTTTAPTRGGRLRQRVERVARAFRCTAR